MWILVLITLLLTVTPSVAEQGFDPKYERDYNIFNPLNQDRADNPLNLINAYDPKNPGQHLWGFSAGANNDTTIVSQRPSRSAV